MVGSWFEAPADVEAGCALEHDEGFPRLIGQAYGGGHQGPSDALPLVRRQHGQRAEREPGDEVSLVVDPASGQLHVADDVVAVRDRDETEALISQDVALRGCCSTGFTTPAPGPLSVVPAGGQTCDADARVCHGP